MYLTKIEAKQLLNDVFRPQFKDVICALNDIETAIGLLPQALPAALPESGEYTINIPDGVTSVTIVKSADTQIQIIEQ